MEPTEREQLFWALKAQTTAQRGQDHLQAQAPPVRFGPPRGPTEQPRQGRRARVLSSQLRRERLAQSGQSSTQIGGGEVRNDHLLNSPDVCVFAGTCTALSVQSASVLAVCLSRDHHPASSQSAACEPATATDLSAHQPASVHAAFFLPAALRASLSTAYSSASIPVSVLYAVVPVSLSTTHSFPSLSAASSSATYLRVSLYGVVSLSLSAAPSIPSFSPTPACFLHSCIPCASHSVSAALLLPPCSSTCVPGSYLPFFTDLPTCHSSPSVYIFCRLPGHSSPSLLPFWGMRFLQPTSYPSPTLFHVRRMCKSLYFHSLSILLLLFV